MTLEQLAEIEKRANGVPPPFPGRLDPEEREERNWSIRFSRADVPALIAEVRRLRAVLKVAHGLAKALENIRTYPCESSYREAATALAAWAKLVGGAP